MIFSSFSFAAHYEEPGRNARLLEHPDRGAIKKITRNNSKSPHEKKGSPRNDDVQLEWRIFKDDQISFNLKEPGQKLAEFIDTYKKLNLAHDEKKKIKSIKFKEAEVDSALLLTFVKILRDEKTINILEINAPRMIGDMKNCDLIISNLLEMLKGSLVENLKFVGPFGKIGWFALGLIINNTSFIAPINIEIENTNKTCHDMIDDCIALIKGRQHRDALNLKISYFNASGSQKLLEIKNGIKKK